VLYIRNLIQNVDKIIRNNGSEANLMISYFNNITENNHKLMSKLSQQAKTSVNYSLVACNLGLRGSIPRQ